VLSDNGSAYRSHLWRDACADLGITHKRTRPYRPQTNGKICEDLARRCTGPGLTPAKV
jgi:transposase InsO family protein